MTKVPESVHVFRGRVSAMAGKKTGFEPVIGVAILAQPLTICVSLGRLF